VIGVIKKGKKAYIRSELLHTGEGSEEIPIHRTQQVHTVRKEEKGTGQKIRGTCGPREKRHT